MEGHNDSGGRTILYSVVIPAYNSSTSLEELAQRIGEVFRDRPGDEYEIVFVDDDSRDPATWPTLERLCAGDSRVRAVRLMRNFGQQAATLCGLAQARGDWVVTMDDDLQHDPADLARFLGRRDADAFIGQLRNRSQSLEDRASSWIKSRFDRWILGVPGEMRLSSFRMLSRKTVDSILAIHTPYPFIPAQLFYATRRVAPVEVEHHPRRHGRGHYSFAKRLRLFTNLLVSNSALLLKGTCLMGIGVFLFSLLLGVWVVYRKLFYGIPVQGWASLMVATLFIGGTLLLVVGVFGEYLLRIMENVEGKPTYLVRDRVGFDGREGREQ